LALATLCVLDLRDSSPLVGKRLDHQVYLQQIQWGDDSWVAVGVCFPLFWLRDKYTT